MSFDSARKYFENLVHTIFSDIDKAAASGLKFLEDNVPAAAIKIGETLLAGSVAGTPWATLVATLIIQAEAAGIKLAQDAAHIVLNTAQSNLIATGAMPPVAA